jgi:predicted DNA binding CopG/RHH family protein
MRKLPKFNDERQESEFWDTHDSTEFFTDTEEVEVTFVDDRPKTLISIRFEPQVIEQLKILARRQGIGYQTLLRRWTIERLSSELEQENRASALSMSESEARLDLTEFPLSFQQMFEQVTQAVELQTKQAEGWVPRVLHIIEQALRSIQQTDTENKLQPQT